MASHCQNRAACNSLFLNVSRRPSDGVRTQNMATATDQDFFLFWNLRKAAAARVAYAPGRARCSGRPSDARGTAARPGAGAGPVQNRQRPLRCPRSAPRLSAVLRHGPGKESTRTGSGVVFSTSVGRTCNARTSITGGKSAAWLPSPSRAVSICGPKPRAYRTSVSMQKT